MVRLLFLVFLLLSIANGVSVDWAQNPECSLPLIDSCTTVGPGCDRLAFDRKSLIASCARTLWVSNVQAIYNEFSETNSFTTKWTKIEQLQCKNNNWEISWKDAKGTRQNEKISLDRKVYCSTNQPSFEASAFWEHRGFFPTRANFASVKPAPLAWCPDGTSIPGCGGYCVISYKDAKFEKSCHCIFGWKGSDCWTAYDPYGLDVRERPKVIDPIEWRKVGPLVAQPLPGANRDTCNILQVDGCPDEKEDKCTKLRYFDSGVHCTKQLWVSVNVVEWEKIDGLECTKGKWEIRRNYGNMRREVLEEEMPVEINDDDPPFPKYIPKMARRHVMCSSNKPEAITDPNSRILCFRNTANFCQNNGQCTLLETDISCNCQTASTRYTGYAGERCHLHRHLIATDIINEYYYRPFYRPDSETGRNGTRIEICDSTSLEDGCRNNQCKKLHANATHVRCNEKLWLNYGEENDWMLDWHDISGVKCVNNVWQSECSRVIGKSLLVCSSTRPSPFSNSLWLTIIVAAIVLLLIIIVACCLCLLCYRNRRVEHRSRAKSVTAHSPYCASSTRYTDKTETETTRED